MWQSNNLVAETMPSPHMLCLWDYFPELEKQSGSGRHISHSGKQNVFKDVHVTCASESLWAHVNQLAYPTRGHPPKQTSCEYTAPCALHKSEVCCVEIYFKDI